MSFAATSPTRAACSRITPSSTLSRAFSSSVSWMRARRATCSMSMSTGMAGKSRRASSVRAEAGLDPSGERRRDERVADEPDVRDGADPTRHGGDRSRLRRDLVEIEVADHRRSPGHLVLQDVEADVDRDHALADHVPGHEAPYPGGHDQ